MTTETIWNLEERNEAERRVEKRRHKAAERLRGSREDDQRPEADGATLSSPTVHTPVLRPLEVRSRPPSRRKEAPA